MSLTSPTSPIDLFRTFSLESQKGQPVDPKKVVQLAQEFEAMLMLQMVRQMRQSITFDDEKEEGFGNETMTDTFDVELSRYLAQSGGIALGSMIQRQLSKETQGSSTDTSGDVPAATKTPAPVLSPLTPPPPRLMPLPSPGMLLPSRVTPLPLPSPVVDSTDGNASPSALTMPLDGATTSGFGWRKDPLGQGRRFHSGVDLRAAYGTEVPAAAGGEVTFAGDRGGYGTMVVVRHDEGFETRYGHLSSLAVQVGDHVEAGQAIGRVGSSGRSTGPHLHFEVLRNGQQLDPTQVTGSRAAEFKFVSRVDDSLHEPMVPSSTRVLRDGLSPHDADDARRGPRLTDVLGADDEDSGREAR